jgi:hypothetical protein
MVTWKRSITITSRRQSGREEGFEPQLPASFERLGRLVERIAKGILAATLYGSGTLVVSGILFYFSWRLGLTALFVLSGLLPLGASVYLLWRLMRRGRPSRPWRYKAREAAILRLAQRLGGRLTIADVAVGTGLTLRQAEATLNRLVQKGYADLHVSASGVLVYHCFPLAGVAEKDHAERILP